MTSTNSIYTVGHTIYENNIKMDVKKKILYKIKLDFQNSNIKTVLITG